MSTPLSNQNPNPNQSRPCIALVSISRLTTLCETVAPRYTERAKFFSVREGYGAAVTALQAYIEAGTVDEERYDSYVHLRTELESEESTRQATRKR